MNRKKSSLENLEPGTVAQHCARETRAYFNRQGYNPDYCYELFRRAIVNQDEAAWAAVYEQYGPLVRGWIRRHAAFPYCREEIQYFVNRAFEKMWASIPQDKFHSYPNLQSLLRYLQLCVNSTIIDHTRANNPEMEGRNPAPPNPQPQPEIEAQVIRRARRQRIWDFITTRLKDKRERIVVVESFASGLKPRQIMEYHQDLFTDVGDVYRIKENFLARLQRDPEIASLLQEMPE